MRPVTLFTGQFADIPLEKLAAQAKQWGYDGLELACWGDHVDVDRAAKDKKYAQGQVDLLARHGLKVFAISNHRGGPARVRSERRCPVRPVRSEKLRRRFRGQAKMGGRCHEKFRPGGPKHGRQDRQRFYRFRDLAHVVQFSAGLGGNDGTGVR